MHSLVRPALLLVAFALGVAYADEPNDDDATPLWKAVEDGLVSVEATSAGGYERARLVVQNRTARELRLDVNGSQLKPRNGSEQPLALGLVKAGEHGSTIRVPAHGKAEGEVASFCMASHLHSPHAQAGFTLVPQGLTGDAARLMKHWRELPGIDQSRIQTALWNGGANPPADLEPPPTPEVVCDLPADTKAVSVVDGAVFVVRGNGDLVRARSQERFEKVAQEITDMVEDGAALHLVTTGLEVKRYEAGSGEVTAEAKLEAGDRLLWAAPGEAAVRDGQGLALVAGGRERLGGSSDRLVRADGGALVLAATGDHVTKLPVSGGTQRVNLPVTVSDLAPSPEGTYAVGEKGALLRFGEDGRAVRVQHLLAVRGDDAALRLGGCERVCRALRGVPGGVLVETDMDTVLVRPEEPPLHIAPLPEGSRLLVDGKTGDLYAARGVDLRRYDATRTGWVRVRFKEAAH